MAILAIAVDLRSIKSLQVLHDFAGKGVLNVLGGMLSKWYFPF